MTESSVIKQIAALVLLGVGSVLALSFFAKDFVGGFVPTLTSQVFISVSLILAGLFLLIRNLNASLHWEIKSAIAGGLLTIGIFFFNPKLPFFVLQSSLGLNVPQLSLDSSNILTLAFAILVAFVIYWSIKKIRKG